MLDLWHVLMNAQNIANLECVVFEMVVVVVGINYFFS
jgi:hypothetical protein